MASITIRNIDDRVKRALRLQAAGNGRSMEEEARIVLAESVRAIWDGGEKPTRTMADVMREVHRLVDEVGGFDIEIEKEPPVSFEEYERMHGSDESDRSGEAA